MKKAIVVLLVGMVAVGAQSAVMDWGTSQLLDTQSGDGYLYLGTLYADVGTDLYLVYNGVSNADPLGAVTQVGGVLAFGGTLVDQQLSVQADLDLGSFIRTEPVAGLTWLGDTSASWEDMNLRTFSIIAVRDTDGGDLSTGAWYGSYTGNAANFSTGTGASSIGNISTATIDASQFALVPEPATFGLMAVAGIGMFLARKKTRI